MYYTSVTRIGNKIYHRYVDNGKRHMEIVENFEYELFLKSEYSDDSTSVYRENLKRHVFHTINDMNSFVNEVGSEIVYGNTDPVSQFIKKRYPDTILLEDGYVVLNYDIETEHAEGKVKYHLPHPVTVRDVETFTEKNIIVADIKNINYEFEIFDEEKQIWISYDDSCYAPKSLGFPEPNVAACEVLSISMIYDDKYVYVLGTKEYEGTKSIDDSDYTIVYVKCANEKELLLKFINLWRQINPDFITGWNIDTFDTPYMINRITRVLGKKAANMLSPFSAYSDKCIVERQKEDRLTYGISGITSFDYMKLYQKFTRDKKENYKLDYIGEIEIGHKKISYEEFDNSLMKLWEYGYEKFVMYNAVDSLIVNKLNDKLKFISLAITIAHISKSDTSDALGTVKPWDNIIYNMLSKKGLQIIPMQYKSKGAEFLGAFVKIPILGRHGWVITVDATSLYPMIIIMFNISPETLVHREIGSDISANSSNILLAKELLDNIEYRIERDPDIHTSESDDHGVSLEDIDPINTSLSKEISNLSINQLNKLAEDARKFISHNSSGHEYIKGVKTVAENIEATIDMKHDLSFAKELNVSVAGNGSTYRLDIDGVLPQAMQNLFNYRKSLKTEMKEKAKLLQEYKKKLENM